MYNRKPLISRDHGRPRPSVHPAGQVPSQTTAHGSKLGSEYRAEGVPATIHSRRVLLRGSPSRGHNGYSAASPPSITPTAEQLALWIFSATLLYPSSSPGPVVKYRLSPFEVRTL